MNRLKEVAGNSAPKKKMFDLTDIKRPPSSKPLGEKQEEDLRFLIARSAHIIEDISTKSSINLQKLKEWKNITTKFCELAAKERSTVELKLAWTRLKTIAKSNLSLLKRETTNTGGTEDLAEMAITPQDFQIQVNNFDSDAPLFTEYAEQQPGSSEDQIIYAEPLSGDIQDHIYCAESCDENNTVVHQAKTDKEMPKSAKKRKNKKRTGNQKSSDKVRHKIVETNNKFKQRQLEMMELEHQTNMKIADLKIKKLKLEIAILENQQNNRM